MPKSGCVLYTGAFRFPDHDAAAFRVFSIAQLLTSSGLTVAFAGWERHDHGKAHYKYRGYACFPQDEFRSGAVNSFNRLLGFLFRGHRTLRWIWKHRKDFEAIVAYNPPALFALVLLLLGKICNFKVILDSTEWYESTHLVGGFYGFASIENWLRMNLIYKLFDHVICISTFLEKHYLSKNVMRVPPLMPMYQLESVPKPPIRQGISLIYAGEAGKKDQLAAFISSLGHVREKVGVSLQLNIVGMNWRELSELLNSHGLNPQSFSSLVVCHGWVPREQVLRLYAGCHFSVLFRDFKRYALAGFPTKAMESLAYGCPIITNAVGDLSKFAENNVNALVMSESEIARQLPTMLVETMSDSRYVLMADAARRTAIELFSPIAYQEEFSEFIESVLGRKLRD